MTIIKNELNLISHLNRHYRFFKKWRPTITFSVGRLLWGWIPPQFFSNIT
jgi:hypothetical protein